MKNSVSKIIHFEVGTKEVVAAEEFMNQLQADGYVMEAMTSSHDGTYMRMVVVIVMTKPLPEKPLTLPDQMSPIASDRL